jgi:hypothetical protein
VPTLNLTEEEMDVIYEFLQSDADSVGDELVGFEEVKSILEKINQIQARKRWKNQDSGGKQ